MFEININSGKQMKTLLIALAFMSFSVSAHMEEEICEVVNIVDIKSIYGETWVQYTLLVHFGSGGLHMRTSPQWTKKIYMDELCGEI